MDSDTLTQMLDRYLPDAVVIDSNVVDQGAENTTVIASLVTGRVVIRIFNERHSTIGVRQDDDVASELEFMEYCQANGLPVPQVLRSSAGNQYEILPNGAKYLLMNYVDGAAPRNFTPVMLNQVASAMATMHNLVKDYDFSAGRSWPAGSMLDAATTRIKKYRELKPDSSDPNRGLLEQATNTFEEMLATVDFASLPQGVIHGDIMWQNLKFDGEKLAGIFDFDDCRRSYFIEDIVKAILFDFDIAERSMFGPHGQNADIFLHDYQLVRELSSAELRSLPLFFLARFIYHVTRAYDRLGTQSTDHITRALEIYDQNKHYFELSSLEPS